MKLCKSLFIIAIFAAAAIAQGIQPGPGLPNQTGGGGLSWTHGTEFTSSAGVLTPTTSGSYFGFANLDQSIDSELGSDTYFVISKADVPEDLVHLYLAPASGSPYSATPDTTGLWIRGGDVLEWTGAAYTYRQNIPEYVTTGIRVGFTSAGNLRVWNDDDGATVWTSSGTYTGTYILVAKRQNDTNVENAIVTVSSIQP